jgi:hypothetical protein
MCHIESSFRCPALSACEPSPQIFAAGAASCGGGPAACWHAWGFEASSASLYPARPEGHSAHADPREEGGVHGEAAPQLDWAGTSERPAKRDDHQRLGRKCFTALATSRFCPWVKLRPRGDTKCGWRPCGIVWRRKKSLTHTEFWCPRRECFLLK